MAAYSAVVSLEQLLKQLLNSDQFSKEEICFFHERMSSIKSSLEIIFPAPKKNREEANKLAIRIREKIFEAQDTFEYFIFSTQNHLSEPPETSESKSLTSISIEEIIASIDPIIEEAKKLADSIVEGKKYSQPLDGSHIFKSSGSGRNTKIVGQERYKALIEKKVTAETSSRLIIPICGMPGVGKTTLARSIYEDANITSNFPFRACVTLSQDDNILDVMAKILSNMEYRGRTAGDKLYQGNEYQLMVEVHKALYNNKYLVVIDDVWDPDILMRIFMALPDNENGSRVLVTSRMIKVAQSLKNDFVLEMQPLNEIDS